MAPLYPDFETSCRDLAALVAADGFRPRLVVGIATGGDYVAERLAAALPGAPELASVRLQRASTPAKGSLAPLIRRLPRRVNNLLRRAEHHARIFGDRLRRPAVPQAELPAALRAALRELLAQDPRADILVADDAVDSGRTMLAVVRALRDAAPAARIRTAAVTVTRRDPLISPDYSLYQTLIRFPWSLDA